MIKNMTKKERQILFWRILIGFLIVSNMAVIFMFSAQSRSQSSALSTKITTAIVRIFSNDNKNQSAGANKNEADKNTATTQKPSTETSTGTTANKNENNGSALTKEQQALVNKSHTPIRKIAHMLEFGSLATLSLLFLITWPGKLWWRYLAALGFTLIYAGTDEFHQLFIDGRGPQLSDVFVDFTGALIASTIALIIIIIVRRIQTPKSERLPIVQELSACFAWVPKTFSCVCAFVSTQVSKIKTIHLKKEKEN